MLFASASAHKLQAFNLFLPLQDTRASFDIRGHTDPAHSERRASIQMRRASSRRVRFEQDNLRAEARRISKEERKKKQHEAKLKKLQEAREKKIAETLKKAEAQMQNTFVAKIFKSQQDFKKLDSLGLAAEQAKRRADYRMKQLKQLEERKLDCRVILLPTCSPLYCSL